MSPKDSQYSGTYWQTRTPSLLRSKFCKWAFRGRWKGQWKLHTYRAVRRQIRGKDATVCHRAQREQSSPQPRMAQTNQQAPMRSVMWDDPARRVYELWLCSSVPFSKELVFEHENIVLLIEPMFPFSSLVSGIPWGLKFCLLSTVREADDTELLPSC